MPRWIYVSDVGVAWWHVARDGTPPRGAALCGRQPNSRVAGLTSRIWRFTSYERVNPALVCPDCATMVRLRKQQQGARNG